MAPHMMLNIIYNMNNNGLSSGGTNTEHVIGSAPGAGSTVTGPNGAGLTAGLVDHH